MKRNFSVEYYVSIHPNNKNHFFDLKPSLNILIYFYNRKQVQHIRNGQWKCIVQMMISIKINLYRNLCLVIVNEMTISRTGFDWLLFGSQCKLRIRIKNQFFFSFSLVSSCCEIELHIPSNITSKATQEEFLS